MRNKATSKPPPSLLAILRRRCFAAKCFSLESPYRPCQFEKIRPEPIFDHSSEIIIGPIVSRNWTWDILKLFKSQVLPEVFPIWYWCSRKRMLQVDILGDQIEWGLHSMYLGVLVELNVRKLVEGVEYTHSVPRLNSVEQQHDWPPWLKTIHCEHQLRNC